MYQIFAGPICDNDVCVKVIGIYLIFAYAWPYILSLVLLIGAVIYGIRHRKGLSKSIVGVLLLLVGSAIGISAGYTVYMEDSGIDLKRLVQGKPHLDPRQETVEDYKSKNSYPVYVYQPGSGGLEFDSTWNTLFVRGESYYFSQDLTVNQAYNIDIGEAETGNEFVTGRSLSETQSKYCAESEVNQCGEIGATDKGPVLKIKPGRDPRTTLYLASLDGTDLLLTLRAYDVTTLHTIPPDIDQQIVQLVNSLRTIDVAREQLEILGEK